MIGADLASLGLTTREIRTAFRLRAIYEGSGDAYQVTSSIIDGVVVHDDKSYLLGNFGAGAYVSQDSTAAAVDNKMLKLQMESNTSPADFTDAIIRHYRSYLSDEFKFSDTIENPVNLRFRGMVAPAPILREVFLVDLEEMDTINLSVDFKEEERTLDALVSLPYVNYAGAEVDSLAFVLNSGRDNFDFNLGFNTLSYGPVAIMKTDVTGRVDQETLFLDFQAFHNEERLVHVQSETTRENDTVRIHLNPQNVILNSKEWAIPQNNEALFAESSIVFNNFIFSRNEQEFSIRTDLPDIQTGHIGFNFENFKLAALLSYLNPQETLATGRMN